MKITADHYITLDKDIYLLSAAHKRNVTLTIAGVS